jgi:glycyl-tRNA synthetase (class II)
MCIHPRHFIDEDYEVVCPISGTRNWTDVRQFNLMFSTEMGSTADGAMKIYLRPETAQGIFVNYLNVQKTGRMKIPFGIAQIGKAFQYSNHFSSSPGFTKNCISICSNSRIRSPAAARRTAVSRFP